MVAVLIGFRPHADLLHWLAAMGVLALFVTAMSWFSALFGLLVRSVDAANGITWLQAATMNDTYALAVKKTS